MNLCRLFHELDCALVEVNPLVVTEAGDVLCLDAKVNVDNNALYRQPALAELRDLSQEDEREAQADEFGLNYVALDGNIGCMVNGAVSPWAPWIWSSCKAAIRPTFWMWAAVPPSRRLPKHSRSSFPTAP